MASSVPVSVSVHGEKACSLCRAFLTRPPEKEKSIEHASTDEDIENRLHVPVYRAEIDTSGVDEKVSPCELAQHAVALTSEQKLVRKLDIA